MGKKERVILIKGGPSKWYEQAIFIVNQNMPQDQMPVDFVAEAEQIINNYVKKNNRAVAAVAYASTPKPSASVKTPASCGGKASVPSFAKNPVKRKRDRGFDFFLNSLMALGCIAIVLVLLSGVL